MSYVPEQAAVCRDRIPQAVIRHARIFEDGEEEEENAFSS